MNQRDRRSGWGFEGIDMCLCSGAKHQGYCPGGTQQKGNGAHKRGLELERLHIIAICVWGLERCGCCRALALGDGGWL